MTYASEIATLVEECKLGGSRPQHILFKRFAGDMYNVSLRIVGNTADAEDIVQLSFIHAYNHIDELKSNKLFASWLKRIVVNLSIDCYRRNKRWNIVSLDDGNAVLKFFSTEYGASEQDNENERIVEVVQEEIIRLADGYRLVLCLYLIDGYNHGEIAKFLGITKSTSRSQYMRAKRRLKKLVQTKLDQVL